MVHYVSMVPRGSATQEVHPCHHKNAECGWTLPICACAWDRATTDPPVHNGGEVIWGRTDKVCSIDQHQSLIKWMKLQETMVDIF